MRILLHHILKEKLEGDKMKTTADQEYRHTVQKLKDYRKQQSSIYAALKYLTAKGINISKYNPVTGEKYGR